MNSLMAIVDFLPVSAFMAAAVILQRKLYAEMSKGAFALFSAGTIIVFVAGLFKATWKLLYVTGVCDFQALNKCFFPMQTVGFVLAALGIVAVLFHRQEKLLGLGVAPAVFSGTMLFVVFMVLGVAVLDAGLCVIAKRAKKYAAIPMFIISFIFILAMGYLSSKDFEQAYMNWIAECVNLIGQGLFLAGAIILNKEHKETAE